MDLPMCSPFQQWHCCVWVCWQQGLGGIPQNSKGHLGSELLDESWAGSWAGYWFDGLGK